MVATRGEADHGRQALSRAELDEAALGVLGIAGHRAQRGQREAQILQAQRTLERQPSDPLRGGAIKRAVTAGGHQQHDRERIAEIQAHDLARLRTRCGEVAALPADSIEQTTVQLAAHAIDVVLLGDFDSAADAPAQLRALRAGQLHTRIHPAQPVVTIGDGSVRAYDGRRTRGGALNFRRLRRGIPLASI
jgi:hypothetical protein